MSRNPKPLVALVGRPNVGKSTLFNRLIGQRHAIVEDLPGTTRDRIYGDVEWQGRTFLAVDTGGIEPQIEPEQRQPLADPLATASAGFVREIREQAQAAIAEADVILLLVDASEGLTSADEEIAELLRTTSKPVLLVANKADNEQRRLNAVEFYALGLGDPFPISAYHGTGTGDLLDEIVAHLPQAPALADEEDELLRIAIVGRPNVGKSSLLNALLGHDRAIVSDIAGTTRDPVDTYLVWDGEPLILVDTAGIRRRGHIERGIEKYSVLRALRAIGRAEVVLLVVDAVEGVTAQDAHIGGYILEENRSLVLVVNKWDAIDKDTHTMVEFTRVLREELKFLDYVPILFVSALTRQRVNQIIPTALRVREERYQRIPTAELNKLLQDAVIANPPKSFRGKKVRFYYATQAEADPPTFVFFVNEPSAVHFSYQRFLENRIRERYQFEGTPIKLQFRGKAPKKEG